MGEKAQETLDARTTRRLAVARAGLLQPEPCALPRRAAGRGKRAWTAIGQILRRFGYLQLDTVSIAGARSHALVLLSRLDGLDPTLAEEVLRPGRPFFEYWGHEACWLPLELYPVFAFRRRAFRTHPWWGDLLQQYPRVAEDLLRRVRDEGPLRSADIEGGSKAGWWNLGPAKRVAAALWSAGDLAVRERRGFQRTWDLTERVIPDTWRAREAPEEEAIETLLLRALAGHGWATTGTLAATWRLRGMRPQIGEALERLRATGQISPCALSTPKGQTAGWIRPADLELAARLHRARPRRDRGVLLSPFDPLLWDRARVRQLFDFEQVLEIYKPAPQRVYGYYCLPVLAGDRLVARFDLKAERREGRLRVLARHFEGPDRARPAHPADEAAATSALERLAASLALRPVFD